MVKITPICKKPRQLHQVTLPYFQVLATSQGRRLLPVDTAPRLPIRLRVQPLRSLNCLEVEELPMSIFEGPDEKQLKCCCIKTRCLKMYCECFSNEQFCGPLCGCTDCGNTKRHQAERN
jgi:hypothetical protein